MVHQGKIIIGQVYLEFSRADAGQTITSTAPVPAVPSGYQYIVVPSDTGWFTVNSISISGTTLSVTGINSSPGPHSTTMTICYIYYKESPIVI